MKKFNVPIREKLIIMRIKKSDDEDNRKVMIMPNPTYMSFARRWNRWSEICTGSQIPM